MTERGEVRTTAEDGVTVRDNDHMLGFWLPAWAYHELRQRWRAEAAPSAGLPAEALREALYEPHATPPPWEYRAVADAFLYGTGDFPPSPANVALAVKAVNILAAAPEAELPDGLDEAILDMAIHNTECGYASHIPNDDGIDPNPCAAKAERIATEYARLHFTEASDR